MRLAAELPDVVTFNSLDIKKAEEVFEKSASELPGVVKLNSLIGSGCTQQGETKKAEGLCEKTRSAAELPDAVTLTSLDIEKVGEVFEKMKSASELPHVGKFNSLIGVVAHSMARPGKPRTSARR